MITFGEFITLNERHFEPMVKNKVSTRKSRRSYIENAIIDLGYLFIIDGSREVEKTEKEIELDKELQEKLLKVYNPKDFNKFCEENYFGSIDELGELERFEAFKEFMSIVKNNYFFNRHIPFARTFFRNNLNENIVVYANGFDAKRPSRVLMAHYDVNTESKLHDNANDNGASIIILLEYLEESIFPSDKNILVVFTDGEEFGGQGAKAFSKQALEGIHGQIEWVLNLDVVGVGNKIVFENIKSNLRNKVEELLGNDIGFIRMPPNDAMYMRNSGIDAICLSVIPDKYWNQETQTLLVTPEHWSNLHNEKDSWETISNQSLSLTFDAVKKIMSH